MANEPVNKPEASPSVLTVARRTAAVVHHIDDSNPTYPPPIADMLKIYFKRLYALTKQADPRLGNPGACTFISPKPDSDPVYCTGAYLEDNLITSFEKLIAETARAPERRGFIGAPHAILLAVDVPDLKTITLLNYAGVREVVFHAEHLQAISEEQQMHAISAIDRMSAKDMGVGILYGKVGGTARINSNLYEV